MRKRDKIGRMTNPVNRLAVLHWLPDPRAVPIEYPASVVLTAEAPEIVERFMQRAPDMLTSLRPPLIVYGPHAAEWASLSRAVASTIDGAPGQPYLVTLGGLPIATRHAALARRLEARQHHKNGPPHNRMDAAEILGLCASLFEVYGSAAGVPWHVGSSFDALPIMPMASVERCVCVSERTPGPVALRAAIRWGVHLRVHENCPAKIEMMDWLDG